MASTDGLPNPFDRLVLDADGSGPLTADGVGSYLLGLFVLPGDALIWLLGTHAAPAAAFFGVGADDYGGLSSAVISGGVWLAAYAVAARLYEAIRDFDLRVTSSIRRSFSTWMLRARIARTLLAKRWHAWRAERAKRARARHADFPLEIDLTPTQLAALRLHAELAPGYALSAGETARTLRMGARAAHDLLDELERLGLLSRAFGGDGDESAYALSAAGKALLAFRYFGDESSGGVQLGGH